MANEIDRLKSQLLISGIQQTNNALYQVINQLIETASNAGSTINNIRNTINPLIVHERNIYVKDYGAIGNGIADDTLAFQNVFNIFNDGLPGNIILESTASYLITKIVANNNLGADWGNINIIGNNAEIIFNPANPAVDDRCFRFQSAVNSFPINPATTPIAIGATTITAQNIADAATLVPGQFIQILELDVNLGPGGDVCAIDWAQVLSVAGAVITLTAPLRTGFTGTHMGVNFNPLITDVHDIRIQDLRITTLVAGTLCINVNTSRNITLYNVSCNASMFMYRAQGLSVINCKNMYEGVTVGATEFAACVDLNIRGSTFGYRNVTPYNCALTIDMASAFFNFIGNDLLASANIALQVLYGVHDGLIGFNTLGYCRNAGIGGSTGILGLGCQRIGCVGNTIAGGDAASNGIAFADAVLPAPDIFSVANEIAHNAVNASIGVPYTFTAADFWNSADANNLTGNTLRSTILSSSLQRLGVQVQALAFLFANAIAGITIESSTGTNAAGLFVKNTGGRAFFGKDNSAGNAIGTGGRAYAVYIWDELNKGIELGVNNTEVGFWDAVRLSLTSTILNIKSYTVATLPAGVANDKAFVTDALGPVFGAAVVGGGAVRVPVYYTGAAWFVG